jgi:hypothetical protein
MKQKKTAEAPMTCVSSGLEMTGPKRVPRAESGICMPVVCRMPATSPPSRKKTQKLKETCRVVMKAKPMKAG